MKKSCGCGEITVEVSGADGTEPAAREEEGQTQSYGTVGWLFGRAEHSPVGELFSHS